MSEDMLRLDGDSKGLVAAINEAQAALQYYFSASGKVIKQTEQFNLASGQVANQWKVIGESGKSVTLAYKQFGEVVDTTSVSLRGDKQALAAIVTELDLVRRKLAETAAKAGDFKTAFDRASQIKTPGVREATLAGVTGLRDQAKPAQVPVNVAREEALRAMQQEQQGAIALAETKRAAREEAIRGLQQEAITEAATTETKRVSREAAIRSLQQEAKEEAAAAEGRRVARESAIRTMQQEIKSEKETTEAKRVARETALRGMQQELMADKRISESKRVEREKAIRGLQQEAKAEVVAAETRRKARESALRGLQQEAIAEAAVTEKKRVAREAVIRGMQQEIAAEATTTEQKRVARETAIRGLQQEEQISAKVAEQRRVAREVAIRGMHQEQQAMLEQAKANEQLYISWQSIIRLFAVQMIHQAIGSMLSGIQQSVMAAKELQIQVALIQTISEAKWDTSKWLEGITQISNATGLLAKDVADGVYETISNQIADGSKALEFNSVVGDFAVVTNSSLKDSISAVSSALNSYGMSVDDAQKVTGSFFRMIDLGKVSTKDFANKLGPIYPLAAQLGVSMNEVNAILAVSTIKGTSFSSAATSIYNIMSRMIKPAGTMKEFIAEMGVNSAQAAIQMSSFTDVFGQIAEKVKNRPEVLAEYFPDVRGMRQAAGLATPKGTEDVNKALRNIEESLYAVADAKKYLDQNPGKQFQQELNKITNYFTTEWGTKVIKNIMAASNAFVSLSGTIKFAADALLFLGTPTVLIGFWELLKASQVTRTALSAMTSGAIGPLAIFAAALVGIAQLANNVADTFEATRAAEEKTYEDMVLAAKRLINEGLRPLDEAAKTQFQGLQKYVAEFSKAFIKAGTDLETAAEQSMDNMKGLNDAFKGYISDLLSDARSLMRATENDLKRLKELGPKLLEDLRLAKLEANLDKVKDDPVKQQQLINQELTRTLNLMKQTTDVKQLEDYTKTAGDLAKQLAKIDEDVAKKNTKSELGKDKLAEKLAKLEQKRKEFLMKSEIDTQTKGEKLKTLQGKKGTITTINGKLQATDSRTGLIVNKGELTEEKRVRTLRDIDAEIAQIKSQLEKTAPTEVKITDAIKTREKIYETAQKRMEEIQKLKEADLIIQQKEVDRIELVTKAISRQFTEIDKFKFSKMMDAKDMEGFDKLSKDQQKNIDNYRTLIMANTKLDFRERRELLQQLTDYEKQMVDARKDYEQKANAVTAMEMIKNLEEQQKVKRDSLATQFNNEQQLIVGYKASLIDLQKRLKGTTGSKHLRAVVDKFIDSPSTELSYTIRKEIINLQEGLAKTQINASDKVRKDTANILTGILTYTTSIVKQMNKIGTSTADLMNEQKKQLDDQLKLLPPQMQLDIKKLISEAKNTAAVEKQTVTMADLVNKLIQMKQGSTGMSLGDMAKLDKINATMDAVATQMKARADADDAMARARLDVRGLSTLPESKAFGGLIRGKDNIPALLSRGEFVVNANATRRFYSQLTAMNGVQSYGNGGLVTNVGDINLSMSSSGNTQTDIVAIGKGLRREIRRGRIKLN